MPRDVEHRRFLEWLLDAVDEHRVDALLVAGDIFDAANPPARAQEAWFRFLGEARRRFAELSIVVIGGNHDSAARLDAPNPVLSAFGVHVVGGVARGPAGIDLDRLLVPLPRGDGTIGAWVVAVPYLRPCDLPDVADLGEDPLIAGVRAVYADVVARAARRAGRGTAVVAMGHLYLAGGSLSELSERRILGGNQHALPADLFPERVAYAALGHLHRAQSIGRPEVRYSGSPIPLSLAERSYANQVVLVELTGAGSARVEVLPVPRARELLRVPDGGFLPVDDVVRRLGELAPRTTAEGDPEPLLEVAVRLERPEPALRRTIEQALDGKGLRLVKISVEYAGTGEVLADAERARTLGELSPEEVFRRRWSSRHEGEPSPELLEAFHELLEQAREEAP